jgi:uncharacterized phage protein (TIGR02218 family)
MRTTTAAMAAHLAGTSHSHVWMLRLDLADGTVIGLTSYDVDVPFDLGDAAGEVTYQSRTGAKISDVELMLGLSPSNYEVSGPFTDDLVTIDAVLGGRFNRAEARLFKVNPKVPAQGALKVLLGNVTDARPEAGEFVLEVRNEADRLNQTVGRTTSPMCDADFGLVPPDPRCGVVAETITGTVTAVTDDVSFTVSFAGGPFADDYFNFGRVVWLTGNLAGTRPVEIFDWTAAGVVTMLVPLAEAAAVGDTCTISRGCSKLRLSDDTSIPTCLTYANVVNFRGVGVDHPGTDKVLRAPIPGGGD